MSTRPVLVMVCHWCGSRPVLSNNGNPSSGHSCAPCAAGHGRRHGRTGREGQRSAGEIADRMPVVGVAGRARPLHRLFFPQPLIADAPDVVAGPGGIGEPPPDLVEDLFTGPVVEVCTESHRGGDLADQLPVGPGLAHRRNTLPNKTESPFGVDHHAVGLGPQCRGQHHVGEPVGRSVGVGILGDHEFGSPQTVDHGGAIRDAGHRWCR